MDISKRLKRSALVRIGNIFLTIIYIAGDLAALAMGFVLAVRLYPMVSPAAVTEPFWAMVTRHLISGLVLAGIWLVLLIKSLYIITDPNRGIYEELNET